MAARTAGVDPGRVHAESCETDGDLLREVDRPHVLPRNRAEGELSCNGLCSRASKGEAIAARADVRTHGRDHGGCRHAPLDHGGDRCLHDTCADPGPARMDEGARRTAAVGQFQRRAIRRPHAQRRPARPQPVNSRVPSRPGCLHHVGSVALLRHGDGAPEGKGFVPGARSLGPSRPDDHQRRPRCRHHDMLSNTSSTLSNRGRSSFVWRAATLSSNIGCSTW